MEVDVLTDRQLLLPVADAVIFAQRDPDRNTGSDPGDSSGPKSSDSGNESYHSSSTVPIWPGMIYHETYHH